MRQGSKFSFKGGVVHIVRILGENFTFVIEVGGATISVDPGEADPVLQRLDDEGLDLTHMLITHHHHDHIMGADEIKRATGCVVYGPAQQRQPFVDHGLGEGDTVSAGAITFEVLSTPGHLTPLLTYYAPKEGLLFSSDIIFGCGCGRVANGEYATMWQSIQRLAALPDHTAIFFAHDYTADNIRFALSVDPDNKALKERAGDPAVVPTTVALEKATNPFVRASSAARFEDLRRRKDVFR